MRTDMDEQNDVLVGKRVRQRRKALKMSQLTLANRLNVSFQQVQKYELGISGIRASRLIDIARVLGTTAGVLCGDNINLNKLAKQAHMLGLHVAEMYKGLDGIVDEIEEVCKTFEGGKT